MITAEEVWDHLRAWGVANPEPLAALIKIAARECAAALIEEQLRGPYAVRPVRKTGGAA